jgi:hypothetical protein
MENVTYRHALNDSGEWVEVDLISATNLLPEYLNLLEAARVANAASSAFVVNNPKIAALLEYLKIQPLG